MFVFFLQSHLNSSKESNNFYEVAMDEFFLETEFCGVEISIPALGIIAAFHWFYLAADVISYGRSVVAGITSPKAKHPRQIPLNY